MQFSAAILRLTIDEIYAYDMWHFEAILYFTEQEIILQSTILVQATGFFVKRNETKRKLH
jgi:hypothetical protein